MADYDVNDALRGNLRIMRGLRGVAETVKRIPELTAEFYANGGPGVGQGVVMDRFQGQGNARFAPLSKGYFDWKSGKSAELNKGQKARFGKGSRLISVQTGTKMKKDSSGGMINAPRMTKILPILVLTGLLRASVGARRHYISSLRGMGDVAYVTFIGLPEYAKAHHDPKKAGRVRRSPVAPNLEDMRRLAEFVKKRITMLTASFSSKTVTTFGGAQARIIQ